MARATPRILPGYRRAFWSRREVFEMRLPTRGYYRELEPPIPVDVLEGRIKGTLTKPIADGGLNLGRIMTSLVIAAAMVVLVAWMWRRERAGIAVEAAT